TLRRKTKGALQRQICHKLYIECADIQARHKRWHCRCKYPCTIALVHISPSVRIVICAVFGKINVFGTVVKPLSIIPVIVIAVAESFALRVSFIGLIARLTVLVMRTIMLYILMKSLFTFFMILYILLS